MRPDVPKAVIARLSLYLRELLQLVRLGKDTISSRQLGRRLGITDVQVRKDFAYFGQLGHPGKGYVCEELIPKIRQILGTDRVWPVALVGCGNLGQALLGYSGFSRQGFRVVAAFDTDPKIVGQSVAGLKVLPFEQFEEKVAAESIRLAMLAVPPSSASEAVDQMVNAGMIGILNFSAVTLNVPKRVSVIDIDLAMELEQLAFAVVKSLEKKLP